MKLRAGHLGFLCAFACGDRGSEFAALPSLEPEFSIGFVVLTNLEADRIEDIHPPMKLDDTSMPSLSLEWPDGQRLFLIAIDDERLTAHGLTRRPTDAMDVRMVPHSRGCERGYVYARDGEIRAELSVDLGAQAFELSSTAAGFRETEFSLLPAFLETSLDLPLAGSACPDVETLTARPFDPEAVTLLPQGATVGGRAAHDAGRLTTPFFVYGVQVIEETRVLALGRSALFDFRRGRAYEDLPKHRLLFSEVAGLSPSPFPLPYGWAWGQAARLPSTVPGVIRLVAHAIEFPGEGVLPSQSALILIELDTEGFISARTSTVIEGQTNRVLTEDDGSIVILGQRPDPSGQRPVIGFRLTAPSPEGPWDEYRFPEISGFHSLVATGLPSRPHLAGFDEGRLMAGDLARAPSETTAIRLEGDIARRGRIERLALSHQGERSTFWAGDHKGSIFRGNWSTGSAERVLVHLPVEARACGGPPDACGHSEPGNDISGLSLVEGETALLMSVRDCTAVVALRLSDLCPTTVALPVPRAVAGGFVRREFTRSQNQVFVSDLGTEIHVIDTP